MDRLQKAVALAVEKNKTKTRTGAEYTGTTSDGYSNVRLESLSKEHLLSQRIFASEANSAESQIFKMLRTKVLSKMQANNWKTIAISSPTVDQGKSTIAANLSVAMSMESTHSTLLVDLDLRRPNLHQVFGFSPKTGIADVLREEIAVEEALINPGIDRLTILPGTEAIENSSEWMSSPAMHQLFSEFKSRYRSSFVVYDMPALLFSDDALKSIGNFDCSLLVLEDGKSSADQIRQSLQIMKQTNFMGYVLNRVAGPLNSTSEQE